MTHRNTTKKHLELKYSEIEVKDWHALIEYRSAFDSSWIFRGQPIDLPLTTSLERACDRFCIHKTDIPGVEHQLVRGFRRRYEGTDRQHVLSDTLYCLDIMQHYGAPTRLLDWTYSFLIATFFAMDRAGDEAIVWCVNGNWLTKQVEKIIPTLLKKRNKDSTRNDNTFIKTYFQTKKLFIMAENPFLFHQRQIVQRGVFLCPSRVEYSFNENLQALPGWDKEKNLLKLKLKLTKAVRKNALYDLASMNITSATLFPGLDGFARSMENELYRYEELAGAKTGE